MTWSELNFKTKDVILIAAYAVTLTIAVLTIKADTGNSMRDISDLKGQIKEMQQENKGSSKENQVFLQNMQNQINANTQQILLLKQEVEMLKQYKRFD